MHAFRKTKPINRTCSSRILWGFPRRMVDIFGKAQHVHSESARGIDQ